MLLTHDYAGLSLKALIWAGGAASTLVGSWLTSWVSSKTGVYHNARNSHMEELKQSVLQPIRDALDTQYSGVSFSIDWRGQQYNQLATARELPVMYEPMVIFADPGPSIQSALDGAFLEDARTNHYPDLISGWDEFRTMWLEKHVRAHQQFMQDVASDILAASGLPAHPAPQPGPYVMHLFLAEFVYHRLMQMSVTSLTVQSQAGSVEFVLSHSSTNAAAGTEAQMNELIETVDAAIERYRHRAKELQERMNEAQKIRTSLLLKYSLALAAKKLRGRCVLVRFF